MTCRHCADKDKRIAELETAVASRDVLIRSQARKLEDLRLKNRKLRKGEKS